MLVKSVLGPPSVWVVVYEREIEAEVLTPVLPKPAVMLAEPDVCSALSCPVFRTPVFEQSAVSKSTDPQPWI